MPIFSVDYVLGYVLSTMPDKTSSRVEKSPIIFFSNSTDLSVLAPVEDGPCHLPGVALEHMSLLGATIQETESLKIQEKSSGIRKMRTSLR